MTPATELAESLTVNHRWRWLFGALLLVGAGLSAQLFAMAYRNAQTVTVTQANVWQQAQIDANRATLRRVIKRVRHASRAQQRLSRENGVKLSRLLTECQVRRR